MRNSHRETLLSRAATVEDQAPIRAPEPHIIDHKMIAQISFGISAFEFIISAP
jgi:hypothetical protein